MYKHRVGSDRIGAASIHDRQLRRHRRCVADGLAMTLPGAVMSTGGLVVDRSNLIFFSHDFFKDMDHTVTTKCDVRVLSDYRQVFGMVAAMMETDLTL